MRTLLNSLSAVHGTTALRGSLFLLLAFGLSAAGAAPAAAAQFTATTVDSVGDVGTHSSLALDSNGYAHIAYRDEASGFLLYATNLGGGWTLESVDADGVNLVGEYASIALDAYDEPHIAYYDATNQTLKYANRSEGFWSDATVPTPLSGDHGQHCSLALDAEGLPHIVFRHTAGDTLFYTFYDGNGWTTEPVEWSGTVGEYASLALDAFGRSHLSYYRQSPPAMRYAIRDGSWSIESVSTAGFIMGPSSLALDPYGSPQVAFVRSDAGVILAVPDPDGGWNTELVGGPNSFYVSLAVDAGGVPHLSYLEQLLGDDDLKYSVRIGETWYTQTVDGALSNTGYYSSLALDGEGDPRIAYYDQTGTKLRYADGIELRLWAAGPGIARPVSGSGLGVMGSHLDEGPAVAQLVGPGPTIEAEQTQIFGPDLVLIVFDLSTAVAATWDLVFSNDLGTDTLKAAVVVYNDPVSLDRITTAPGDDLQPDLPRLTAGFDSVAFHSTRDGAGAIFVKAPDGDDFEAAVLKTYGMRYLNPAWSPDGSALVFENMDDEQLYRMDAHAGMAAGPPTLLLPRVDGDYTPAWSPDGSRIAFWRYSGGMGVIASVNPSGGDLQYLTDAYSGQFDSEPVWSPDGERIVFVRDPVEPGTFIFAMSAAEGESGGLDTLVTRNGFEHKNPAWSPDGKWIAFATDTGTNYDLRVALSSGGEAIGLLDLTDDPADDIEPAWTPDGTGIVFASSRGSDFDLYRATNLPIFDDADADLLPDDLDECAATAPAPGQVDRDFDGCADSGSSFRQVRFWSSHQNPVIYETDAVGDPRIADGSDWAELLAGFNAWTLLANVDLEGGDDELRGGPSNAVSGDARNSISFTDPDGYIPGVLATTYSTTVVGDTLIKGRWYRPGEIVDADIVFNSVQFSYSTPTFAGDPGAYDLRSLATHEFGHLFGFSHTSVPQSTMFYVVPLGTAFRTLEQEDAFLAQRIYNFGSIDHTLSGHVYRPDGFTPVVGAAVYAVSDATGDTLRMTFSDVDGYFRLYGLAESFRIWTQPLDGGPEVNGLQARWVNGALDSVIETDFLAEYWDGGAENNSDFGAPGVVLTVPYSGSDADIILNADLDGPVAVSMYPAAGDTGIAASAAMMVKFDEPVDLITAAAGVSLTNQVTLGGVGGAATVLQRDSLLVFTPNVALEYNTPYELSIGPPTEDKFGNVMSTAMGAIFTVQAQPPVAITSATPAEVPVGAALVLAGTGFDVDVADNVVEFAGGASAIPSAATLDRLYVTVPTGAQTGNVTVTVNGVLSNPFPLIILPPKVPPQPTFLNDVTLGGDPAKLAVGPDGAFAYVATDQGVDVVSADPNRADYLSVTSLSVPGGCTGVVTLPDGLRAFAVGPTQPRFHVIDTDPASGAGVFNTIVQDLSLTDPPLGIAVVPGGGEVLIAYTDRVVLHSAASGALLAQELRQWTASGYGFRGDLAVASGAGEAYATTTDGKIAVLGFLPGEQIVAELPAGTSPGEVAASPLGTSVLTGDGQGTARLYGSRGSLYSNVTVSGGFTGVSISPEASFAYLANFTLNRVDILSLQGSALSAVEQFATGIDPRDVTTAQAGRYVYVITGSQDRLEVYDTVAGPHIASVSPAAGGDGTLVTIAGSGFDPVPANNDVDLGGTTLTPDSVAADGSSMLVRQLPGATSSGISVTTGGMTSNSRPYRVVNRPDAGAFAAAPGFTTGGVEPVELLVSPSGQLIVAYHTDGSMTVTRADPTADDFHRTIQTLTAASIPLTSPAAMVMTPDEKKLYVGDPGSSRIVVLDVDVQANEPLTPAGYVRDPVGDLSAPALGLAVTGDGARLFAACPTTDEVHEIATANDSLLATVAALSLPEAVAVHPAGDRLFVGSTNGSGPGPVPLSLSTIVIDPSSVDYRAVTATVTLPGDPDRTHRIVPSPDGSRMFLVNEYSVLPAEYEVLAFDADPTSSDYLLVMGQIGSADLGTGPAAPQVVVNHSGNILYALDVNLGGVDAYEIFSLVLTQDGYGTTGLAGATSLAVSLDDGRLYADGVGDNVEVGDLTEVDSFLLDSGWTQTAVAGEKLPRPLTVQLTTAGPVELLEGSVVWFSTTSTGGSFGFPDQETFAAADATGRVSVEYTASMALEDTILVTNTSTTRTAFITVVPDTSLAAPLTLSVAPQAPTRPGVNTVIAADFSKAINPATVSGTTFRMWRTADLAPVTGLYTFAYGQKRAVLQPSAPLDYATEYTVELTAGLLDYSGNPLSDPGTVSFTSEEPPALNLNAVRASAARVGDPVVLSGTGFSAVAAQNTVSFGGVPATPTSADPGALTVLVPLGALNGDLRVTVGAQTSNGVPFTVLVADPTPVNQNVATSTVPTSGQQIAVVPDGSRAYMTSPGANTLVPIHVLSQSSENPIATGLHPYGVASSPNGDRMYVTNFFSNDVHVIDADSTHATFQQKIATIATGINPTGLAAHPDGRTLYVCNYGDSTLSILDTDSTSAAKYSARATVPTGKTTQTVALTPDGGRIIVGISDGIIIIDANDTSARSTVPTGKTTQAVAVTPDGGLAVLLTTDGTLILIDIVPGGPYEGQARATVPTGKATQSIAVSPDGGFIYVTLTDGSVDVHQIVQTGGAAALAESSGESTPGWSLVLFQNIEVGENPTGLAFDPSGSGLLMVVNSGDKSVSYIQTKWGGPIPVQVLALAVQRRGEAAVISWEIAGDVVDAARFRVYRETEGSARALVAELTPGNDVRYEVVDPEAPAGPARYTLEILDRSGETSRHGPVELLAIEVAYPLQLLQSRPNPFRGSTYIAFQTPVEGRVTLRVFDVQGREVAVPFAKQVGPGRYEVEWTGRDDGGRRVAGGVYFYRLETPAGVRNRRMILMR